MTEITAKLVVNTGKTGATRGVSIVKTADVITTAGDTTIADTITAVITAVDDTPSIRAVGSFNN